MRRSDFNYYTEEQRQFKDKVAIQMTKSSLYTYMFAMDLMQFNAPKPKILSEEELNHKHLQMIRDYDEDDPLFEHIEYVHFAHFMSSMDSDVRKFFADEVTRSLQLTSNFLYYMACNGYKLVEFPNVTSKERYDISVCQWNTRNRFELFDKMKRCRIFEAKFASSKKSSYTRNVELPEEFLLYMDQFNTKQDVITEVCRLMMLGPKCKRAEDAMGAMLNAWENMQRYEQEAKK